MAYQKPAKAEVVDRGHFLTLPGCVVNHPSRLPALTLLVLAMSKVAAPGSG